MVQGLPYPVPPCHARSTPAARDAASPEPGGGLLLQRAAFVAGEAAGEAAQAVMGKGGGKGSQERVGGEGLLMLLMQPPA